MTYDILFRPRQVDELAGMIADARAIRPDIDIGLFLLVGVGDRPEVDAVADLLGTELCGGLAGQAGRALDNLRSPAEVPS